MTDGAQIDRIVRRDAVDLLSRQIALLGKLRRRVPGASDDQSPGFFFAANCLIASNASATVLARLILTT